MYLLLVLSIFAASAYSILLHGFPSSKSGNIYKLNFLSSIVWIFLLFIANGFKLHLNGEVLIWGTAYGVIQALFVFFKAKAMNLGSVSLTTLIGNSSLIISIIFSFIVWNEKISVIDSLGLILLILGIVLSTYKKEDSKTNKKWKYYTLAFFCLAAAVGIIFKAFGKIANTNHTGDMMLVSAIVMTVFYLLFCGVGKDFSLPLSKRKFILYALFAGLLSCLYNRLNITVSSALEAVIFFPAFNGGVVAVSGILSCLIFKEKLSLRQISGFVLGILAIIIIGVF